MSSELSKLEKYNKKLLYFGIIKKLKHLKQTSQKGFTK